MADHDGATLEVDYVEGRTRFSASGRQLSTGSDGEQRRKRTSSFVSLDFTAIAEQNSAMICPVEEMTTCQKIQFYVLFLVEHIVVQTISGLFIIIDISIAIAAIAIKDDSAFEKKADLVSWILLGYFVLEIILRLIGIGPRIFVRNVWEMFDALVISISLILSIAIPAHHDSKDFSKLTIVGRAFRLVRLMRLIPQCRKCILSMRLTTSENKRRYREDGFDLDLTYITERVIAMSFPSEGYLALYRNPIEEVIKFFTKKHENHFMIYNLCSERQYSHQKFNNCVKRYLIDDHNVASMSQMLDFVKNAERYISGDPKNVIAVHCKGGKGRTGSMICAYLMYSDKLTFPTGLSAREFFASQRSDNRINSKCQGVQTPSQCRYIDYFGTIIHKFGCVIPEAPSRFVKTLIVHSPPAVIKMKNCDLLVEICDRDKPLISFNLLSASSVCEHKVEKGTLEINFHDHIKPCVTGDTKIRFVSRKLPRKYDKASFYFWFNTTFIRGGKLFIERELLDNPHFSKFNKVYDPDFGVTVLFDEQQRHSLI